MPYTHCAVVAALVGILTGCTNDALLPPARPFPLESAATLPAGDTGVQLEGGVHGAIFGLHASSGTVRVRHGFAEGTDGSIEASVIHVAGAEPGDSNPNVVSGRVGIKHRITSWLSFTAGLGGGGSAGGGFFSPDLGIIVAYENPVLVPFLQLRGSFSQPFDAHPVVIGQQPGQIPPFTWMGGGVAGIRLPLDRCEPAECSVRSSLLGAVALTDLAYAGPNSPQWAASIGGGAEVIF